MTKLARLRNAAKKSKQRRISDALKKFLKAQNPARKYGEVKVRKNRGGSITIIPVKIPRRASR